MKKKYLCLHENSKHFGKIVEYSKDPGSKDYVLLEALSSSDKKEVEKIVKEILTNMFWRMYTRAGYIVN